MYRTAYVLLSLLVLLGSTVPAAADECTGAAPGDPCDDGIFCNGNDQCGEFQGAWGCLFHSGDPCVGGPECADTCDEGANTCSLPKGTPCNDGLFCTSNDTCDGAGGCTENTGDPCTGGPECANLCDEVRNTCDLPQGSPCTDDENVCTDDECNGLGKCAHLDNDGLCNDGLFCNGTDRCEGGLCSLHAGDPCADGPECANDCSEKGGGTCLTPVDTPCDDERFCNGTDKCDGAGGCSKHSGDPCTGGPECANTCNEEGKGKGNCYVFEGTPCTEEGNNSTDDECNGTGVCVRLPNNEPCDDGLFCNGTDHCAGSSCSLHTGDPCAGGLECARVCDEQGDACAVPLGIPCSSDDNPCTDDLCLNGECTHATVAGCQVCWNDGDCDDLNPCTLDTCEIDGCENSLISDCVACTQDDDCDDGDPCTVDSCGPENRCNQSDAGCFMGVTCTFVGNLGMDACSGERIPALISKLVDRAGCKAEQAENRARDGRRRVEKKLKEAQRSLNKATRKLKKGSGKKLSAPCAAAISADLADRSSRVTALIDRANGGTQLGACTDALTTEGITSAKAMGPSLCGKR